MNTINKGKILYIQYPGQEKEADAALNVVKNAIQNYNGKCTDVRKRVHMYLDDKIVAHYGIQNCEDVADKKIKNIAGEIKSISKDKIKSIRYDTLYHVIDENKNCGLNLVVLISKDEWEYYNNKLENEYGVKLEELRDDRNTEAQFIDIVDISSTEKGKIDEAIKSHFSNSEQNVDKKKNRKNAKDSEPYIVMVAGFPGSGKSTVGKRISAEKKIAFIDKDTIARKISEQVIELENSYPGDYETNAYGGSIRSAQYKDMGMVAAVNLDLKLPVLITAPFTSQARSMFNSAKTAGSDNSTEQMIDELYLKPGTDESTQSWEEKIPLFFVWVRTSREIEHHRIYDRDAERDSWKLKHWIKHSENQNKTQKEFSEFIFEKKTESYIAIFDNEYDDDMKRGIQKVVGKLEYFLKKKKKKTFNFKNDFEEEKPSDEFIFSYDKYAGENNQKMDCYFADLRANNRNIIRLPHKDLWNKDECSTGTDEQSGEKGGSGSYNKVFYKESSISRALVIRDSTYDERFELSDFLTQINTTITDFKEEISQIIFENCRFTKPVAIKKSKYSLEFDECHFNDTFLIFNRKDTGFSSKINISIFRCVFDGDCTIMETDVDTLSIVDSKLEDVIFNHVVSEHIAIFNSTMNYLDIGTNCTCGDDLSSKEQACEAFRLRDCRISDYIRLPNINFSLMNLSGNMFNEIRFADQTLDSLAKNCTYKKTTEKQRPVNINELRRRIDVYNRLYNALTANNNYAQADQCIWHARRLDSMIKRQNANFFCKCWEKIKYFICFYVFGGGIRLGRLLTLFVIMDVIMGTFVAYTVKAATMLQIWYSFYLSTVSILNLDETLPGFNWITEQIAQSPPGLAFCINICNIFGIVWLAVLTATIVRKLIR